MKKLIYLSVIIVSTLLLMRCEGPAGLDGIDGIDGQDGVQGPPGADGNVTCLSCHNTEKQALIATEFARSQHSSGALAVGYAGGRARNDCAKCHSHEGYLEFALRGTILENITNPSPWECSTCHALHTDFEADDYAFRLGDPVAMIADDGATVIDAGNNNTCINCHQARRNATSYDNLTVADTEVRKFTDPDDIAVYTNAAVGPSGSIVLDQSGTTDTLIVTFDIPTTHAYISSTHAGPHHGAQGNVWYGIGGTIAAGTPFAAHSAGCVKCHMGPSSGHSYEPETGNCEVEGCHSSAPLDDLDANDVRIQAAGAVLDAAHAIHLDDPDGGYVYGNVHPLYASLERGTFNAFWNFMLLMEDRSNGAHNPQYVEDLLTDIETNLGL